jgi:hypothetical protein
MSLASRLLRGVAIAVLTSTASCASSPASGASESTPAAPRNPNVLTAAEIASRGTSDGTAYDIIHRLRPNFLNFRGVAGTTASSGTTHVSLDGGSLSDISLLRSIPVGTIAEVRFLSASDAAQRFGTSAGSGAVILIRQK